MPFFLFSSQIPDHRQPDLPLGTVAPPSSIDPATWQLTHPLVILKLERFWVRLREGRKEREREREGKEEEREERKGFNSFG